MEKKIKDPEPVIREIKRQTRRKSASEEKIRIIFEGNWHTWFNNRNLTLTRDGLYALRTTRIGDYHFCEE